MTYHDIARLILKVKTICSPLIGFLQTRISPINARELGFIRVVFAILLGITFPTLNLPVGHFPRELHTNHAPLADWEWVHWLASQPNLAPQLETWIFWSIVVFGLGMFTRFMYPLLVLELTVWTLVRLQHTGTHLWLVALITMWGLLTIRWSDGFSLDEIFRRLRHGRTVPHRRGRGYGFAIWLPGLVWGIAMAAAGISKLRNSGIEWVIGGAVKYHFVTDSIQAPTDWGLWVATHHWAAVLFSLAAVSTEISLGFSPLIKTYIRRLPLAVAGFGLLVGFYVFQNERWYAWWMLWALFFIPWPAIVRQIRERIPAHTIIIDGDCPRCQRTGRVLLALDWFDRLHIITVEEALANDYLNRQETRNDLLASMHVLCRRRRTTVKGYRGYLHIAASLPLLWPLLVFGALPGIRSIGEAVYARFAATRPRRSTEPCPVAPRLVACKKLTPFQTSFVGIALLLQVSASLFRIEVEPVMSDYPMYSNTYESTDDFDRRTELLRFSYIGETNGDQVNISQILDDLDLDGPVRDALLEVSRHGLTEEENTPLTKAIERLNASAEEQYDRVELRADRRAFDWTNGVFYWKARNELIAAFELGSFEEISP